MTTGEYGGVGAIISQRGDTVYINEPYEGNPAQEFDLRPGDAIIAINGNSMIKKSVSDVSGSLKGEAGTTIELQLYRPATEEMMTKTIVRRKILMNAVPYYGMLNDSIGYIYLSSFTDKAAKEMRAAITELKENNPKGLIIDLRNNSGGIMEDAIQIVNMFVPKGQTVLSTKGKIRTWDKEYKTTQEPIDTEIPLVVLVNRASASASEIVSGALQDLDRAVIIGERTFGKGLVQSTRQLPFNGLLKMTSAKYYIPSGRLIQAIDYSNRNEDGSVGRIPDSLTTVFKTANGRDVRDGGGIQPDFNVEQKKLSNMSLYLLRDYYIFDFANQYHATHPSIASAKEFKLTDEDYNMFCDFVKSKNFTYDKKSLKMLEDLKKVAQFEGYSEDAAAEFESLEAKLNHNIDKDLQTFKPEIKEELEQEIVKRYYYQKGEIQKSLQTDIIVDKGVEVIVNTELYNKTLNKPVAKAKKK